MAVILREPFNDFTTNGWVLTGPPTIVTGRTGTAARITQFDNAKYNLSAPDKSETVTVGFAYRASSMSNTPHVFFLSADSGATIHFQLTLLTTGALRAIKYSATTLGTSAAGLIVANVWNYIEVQIKVHDTAGFVIVRVNGADVINVSGVDTRNTGTTPLDQLMLQSSSFGSTHDYDDLYLRNDTVFEGDPTIAADARLARISERILTYGTPDAQLAQISARILTRLGVTEAELAQISMRALVAAPTEIHAGTAPLRIWATTNDGVAACVGRVIVRDGIAGTTVLEVDDRLAHGDDLTEFEAVTGQTVTVTGDVITPIDDVVLARFDVDEYPGGDSYTDPRGRTWTVDVGAVIAEVAGQLAAVAVTYVNDEAQLLNYVQASNSDETALTATAELETSTARFGKRGRALGYPLTGLAFADVDDAQAWVNRVLARFANITRHVESLSVDTAVDPGWLDVLSDLDTGRAVTVTRQAFNPFELDCVLVGWRHEITPGRWQAELYTQTLTPTF